LTEWEAYERVAGPLDDGTRLDELFAMLQATIANVNRGKRQRPYKAEQFRPQWGVAQPNGPLSGDDMLAAVKRINKGMGGDVRRPGSG
jgi:hypothetical protein